MGNDDGKTKEKEEKDKEKMLPAESCKDPDDQIPNEDETLQDRDDDCTEQETFEILDSIDDQTETEEGIPKRRSIEKEECTYQVIDSLEDQPMTTESETDNVERRAMKRGATTQKDDGLSKKQDRTVRKYETRTKRDTTAGVSKKDKETTEEMVFEIVDSVNDEPVQEAATTETSGRRRSARGKKEDRITLNLTEASEKPFRDEEDTYEILDSVEDKTAHNEPTVTTRSTRGKLERTVNKDTLKEKTPTRRRHTPARESQELNKETTPKKDEKALPKESSPTKKSDIVKEVSEEDATFEILDSVEAEVVKVDRPAGRHNGKRGRPRKAVKTTKKDNLTLKKVASEKMADEEEVETYQILDSVEDSGSLAGSAKNEEEEEPVYQIVDSLEDDQEELTPTEVSDNGRKEHETPTCDSTTVETSEKVVVKKMVDGFQETQDGSSAAGGSGTRIDNPNLDQVSEEEEDYPDDTAEEEELRKRQAATKERQLAKEREAKRTRENEERRTREQRSRSSSSRRGGGGNKGRTRKGNEEVEVDTKELVTLDEVGADEAREERAWEITERELQTLVTLDEFVEEEEDGKAERSTLETRPLHQEDESEDSLNPETLVTLDEAGDDDEEEQPHEEEAEKTSRSAKHKHDDDTEETMNFVTVDEVGEVEEEKEVTTRTRGRAKKKTRQTPVRKSTRGKKVSATDERESDVLPPTSLDASSSLDKDLSTLSSCNQPKVQKTETEEEAASQAHTDAASAENQTLEGGVEEEEEERRADIKVVSKQRRELVGPEAKRSRSQSPSVAADLKLPAFKPNNPLGEEFMVPLSGFFCNLCSVFYESTAKDLHCSSQMHYDNLQRHYQKLQQKPSTSST